MREVKFKVKTKSPEEYVEKLEAFKMFLNTWKNNNKGRGYEIEENIEELLFEVVAQRDELLD